MTTFAYCRAHQELVAGLTSTDKGFRVSEASEHFACRLTAYDDITALPRPMFNLLARLGAGVPVGNNAIVMHRLALALEDQWTPSRSTAPAAGSTSTPSPAPVVPSGASMRSKPASAPTWATSAEPDLMTLLAESGGA